MNKAIYIGAGLDILPALLFPSIKEFIFIDSQPFSEFGTHAYHIESEKFISTLNVLKKDQFENLFSRPTFMPTLEKVMNQNNFQQSKSTPDYILYQNQITNQTIKYYYSFSFPEYLDESILNEIKSCNTIIVCGHHPNKVVLEYIQSPTYLIGNNRTHYDYDLDDDDSEKNLIKPILENPGLINKYYSIKQIEDYEWWDSESLIPSVITKYKVMEVIDLKNMK